MCFCEAVLTLEALTEHVENTISIFKKSIFQVPKSPQQWTTGPGNSNTLITLIHKLYA